MSIFIHQEKSGSNKMKRKTRKNETNLIKEEIRTHIGNKHMNSLKIHYKYEQNIS